MKHIFSTQLLICLLCASFISYGFDASAKQKEKIDYMEIFGIGYSDNISFIVIGYQCHWKNMNPKDMDLSPAYANESKYGAFLQYDVNDDGIEELLMGDQIEDGTYQIYDIFTFDKTTGNTIHLFKGGTNDHCKLAKGGIIVETGVTSSYKSFTKYYIVKGLKLKKVKAPKDVKFIPLEMDRFIRYAQPQQPLCGGYSELHYPSKEETALLASLTKNLDATYEAISVSTQVVAGTNYRFYCKCTKESENLSGHCYVVIYKPLQGNPEITSIEKPELRKVDETL